MHDKTSYNPTYWEAVTGRPDSTYRSLSQNIRTDVVVVGAGIVGLTAAHELARAGKKVVVLEALAVGRQVTARSTAKVTSQHGLIYRTLIRNFGDDNAQRYAQANQEAIEYIAAVVAKKNIECGFERLPAYVYTQDLELASNIDDEAVAASTLGLPAHTVTEISAPIDCKNALRFDDQAQFNPLLYLTGLARVVAATTQLYEMTRVVEVQQDGGIQHVKTEAGHIVTAKHVVIASHLPIVPEGKFFAKAFTFSHSVAAAELPAGCDVNGMFITSDEPTYSFRTDSSRGTPYLIAAGPEYKTGVPEEQARSFKGLEAFLHENFGVKNIAYRWTNEDFRSMDGLPFVGPASTATPQLYVATGFGAWGITNGVAAARIIADQILLRENPYSDLFDATRIKLLAGGTEFVKESLESAKQFVLGHLGKDSPDAPTHLAIGEGRVTRENGNSVARYRDTQGILYELSASCTHMGCVVEWNDIDLTWDCPCHGSRFSHDGSVLHGPATTPLEPPETASD